MKRQLPLIVTLPVFALANTESPLRTVSYTHLDVYKRQINNMGLGISGSITGLPIPVTCLFTFLCSLLFIAASQAAGKSWLAFFIHKYARDTAAWMIILLGILECI